MQKGCIEILFHIHYPILRITESFESNSNDRNQIDHSTKNPNELILTNSALDEKFFMESSIPNNCQICRIVI